MSATGLDVPRAAESASASARLVWAALASAEGELTRQELMQRTAVSRRALDDALGALRERDLVLARIHPQDRRRRLYRTRGTARGGGPSTGGV